MAADPNHEKAASTRNEVHPPFKMHAGRVMDKTIQYVAGPVPGADVPPGRAQRHEIGQLVGRGGMGSVFRARQLDLDRDVAMKVMVSRPNSAATEERFRREAHVLGRLPHPNIVPIYEMGCDEGGRPFYTMKLVKGRTLQEIIDALHAKKPEVTAEFTLTALLTVFEKVCDALAFAHSQGVLHRDLKPANIMVGEFGEVLVMDWGLAKLVGAREHDQPGPSPWQEASDQELTMVGDVIGTPRYMSPEQASGKLWDLDQRSDVFSLGGILYAILTLHPPVDGVTAESVLEKVRSGIITPPSVHSTRKIAEPSSQEVLPHCPAGRVPEALSAVTMKALHVDRDRRYQTVAALHADVTAYLNGFATQAEQAGTLRQLHLFMMRHKVLAGSVAAIVMLTIVFLVTVLASERRARSSAVAAYQSATEARTARRLADERSETARKALARSQTSLAEAAYREFDSGTMLAALDGVPEDLRDGDWRYLRGRADNSQAVIRFPDNQNFIAVAAHPARPGVFVGAKKGLTFVMFDARTGAVLGEFPGVERQQRSTYCLAMDFSADGSRLAAGTLSQGGVVVYDFATGRPLAEWDSTDVLHLRLNRDGSRALEVTGKELIVRELAGGRALWRRPATDPVAEFTRDGHVVAVARRRLEILDAGSGILIKSLPEVRSSIFKMVLSPDGSVAYLGCRDSYIRGIRLADGATVFEQHLAEGYNYLPFVALNADGSRLLGVLQLPGHSRIARLWDTKTGASVQSLMGGHGAIEGVAMHPLSDDAVISGPDTRSWALASRREKWSVPAFPRSTSFWTDDDFFISGENRLQLSADGTPVRSALPLPAAFGTAQFADAAGRFAVIARRPSTMTSLVAVLRRDGAKIALVKSSSLYRGLSHVRLNQDGSRFVLADPYVNLEVFDTASGTSVGRPDMRGVDRTLNVCWLGTDRLIVLATHGERGAPDSQEHCRLLDARTGRVLKDLQHKVRSDALTSAPDGRTFAEAGEDKRVRIRDATTLEILREFRAHDGPITAIAFHPTRPLLATCSFDLSVRLWNLEDFRLLEEIHPSGVMMQDLAFSPQGRYLACVDSSGVARIFDITEPPPGQSPHAWRPR